MMNLDLAKRRLREGSLNLVIVKDGKTLFESRSSGIRGLLQAVERFGEGLFGSSAADKVVGRAAAMLCAYSRFSEVFAVRMSEGGRKVLNENNIKYQFEELVPRILDIKQADVCPFEKLVAESKNPKEAYEKLKSCIESSQKEEWKRSRTD